MRRPWTADYSRSAALRRLPAGLAGSVHRWLPARKMNSNCDGVMGMPVRSTIVSLFEEVAREQQRALSPLSDDLELLKSGLDSLSFAIIVARLEDSLGFDPFNADEPVEFPVTFGDFVRLYEKRPG
jgi:acyl carrier protein